MPGGGAHLREARARCHDARDAFFASLEGVNDAWRAGDPIPEPCAETRAAYVAACPKSWVGHFDKDHTQRKALARFLAQGEARAKEAQSKP